MDIPFTNNKALINKRKLTEKEMNGIKSKLGEKVLRKYGIPKLGKIYNICRKSYKLTDGNIDEISKDVDNFINKINNVYMDNRKEIKVFEIKDNVNLPIKSNPNKTANFSIGDLMVCYDGENVYAKDWVDGDEPSFVLLLNNLAFIEANPHLFYCIS